MSDTLWIWEDKAVGAYGWITERFILNFSKKLVVGVFAFLAHQSSGTLLDLFSQFILKHSIEDVILA